MGSETEPEVEPQGTGVALLGVDEHLGGSPPPRPPQGVGDEGRADAMTLMVGVDGEALEVGDALASTRRGVHRRRSGVSGTDNGIPPKFPPVRHCHPEPARGCGGAGLGEGVTVEAPERFEGERVECEDCGVVASPSPPQAGAAHRWQVVEGVGEQVQVFVVGEPALEEGHLFRWCEGRGEDLTNPGVGEFVDRPLHLVGGWPGPGDRGQHGDVGAPVPRRCSEPMGERSSGEVGSGVGHRQRREAASRCARREDTAHGLPGRRRYPEPMRLLVASDPRFALHDTGPGHPERPQRLEAVRRGIEWSGVHDAVVFVEPSPAVREAVMRVHPGTYLDELEATAASGGGRLDPDTMVGSASMTAAMLAAGAGLGIVDRLRAGEGEAGFCAVRPPGHHATPERAMGFCLINNVAVTARSLADAGERVLIVDYDAHHGNGTQDVFWSDPNVVYVSTHEYPLYPGTGALGDMGEGAGFGTTVNFPLPAGATGDVVCAAIDEVVIPLVERFAPTWLLVSAGYDAHRRDPLTGLGLSAGDFAHITSRLVGLVPPGRTVLFLEGGYDLQALAHAMAATVAAMAGTVPGGGGGGGDELITDLRPTSGGPGMAVVEALAVQRQRVGVDPER